MHCYQTRPERNSSDACGGSRQCECMQLHEHHLKHIGLGAELGHSGEDLVLLGEA